jgi:hypothetical protein
MKCIITNRSKPCSVPGCHALRTGYAIHCTAHSSRQRENGHPLQLSIEKRILEPYLRMARRFLKAHAVHPATLAAIETMRECLYAPDQAPVRHKRLNNGAHNTWVELKRLEKADPPLYPEEALRVVIAVWLLHLYEPRRFQNDRKPLTYAIAFHVFRLRELHGHEKWDEEKQRSIKESKAPGSQALNFLGAKIRKKLGVYLMGVERLFRDEEAAREQRARDLASLAVTPTAEEQAAQYDKLAQ